MVQVSTEKELFAALRQQESHIKLSVDLVITRKISISYPVILEGISSEASCAISLDSPFPIPLFSIEGGHLTLRRLTLSDATDAVHPRIIIHKGQLHLESGVHFQNGSRRPKRAVVFHQALLPEKTAASSTPLPNTAPLPAAQILFLPLPIEERLTAAPPPAAGRQHYVNLSFKKNVGLQALPVKNMPPDQSIPQGGRAVLPTGVPSRRGFRFLGWNTTYLGTGTMYQPGQQIENIYNHTKLYAVWRRRWY